MEFNLNVCIKNGKAWQSFVGVLHLLNALGMIKENQYHNTMAQLIDTGEYDFTILFD